MRCLNDREWLVDEVVNFHLEKLQQRRTRVPAEAVARYCAAVAPLLAPHSDDASLCLTAE